jgi:putative ABC transport system permease protein
VAVAVTAAALWIEVRFDSPWSGNVAALAADFALVLMFMRVAGPVALLLLRPVRRAVGFPGRLAIDRLTQIPDQLALAAGILALALGLMLMSATLATSFERSVLEFIRRQVRADLVVASTATTGWVEAPLPEALAERLAAMPGVTRVERLRLAEHDHDGHRISIDSLEESAFGPGREADFTFSDGDPQAAVAAVRAGAGVLVSRNFARRFHAAVGTTLHLDTPAGPWAAPVVGVVVDYVSPRGSVILSRAVYRDRWRDTSVNRYHVTLAAGWDAGGTRRAIARELGAAEQLKVLTQRELYEYHQDAVQRAFRLTLALKLLPLVVAGLGLAEALLAVSLDRRHEFALLRAAGATRGQVARSVLAESVGVGLLGLAGGVLIGIVLAVLWVRVNFVHQLGWQLDFHFATASIPMAALVALVVSVPAGLLPARRVARLPVLDALREG